ncbi:ABC transporter permease [Saccharomonospora sp. NB11]|uniref:ABC transporter permease n=1 Tax=Saccharomonospora sp. NB11 TaxID=1642298 RepID=UPI0018D07B2A|nr:ABC transporter permease [Saccharomonospora sp. NB11]
MTTAPSSLFTGTDPDTRTSRPGRVSTVESLRHVAALVWRGALRIRKAPDQLLDVTLQPLLFLLLFSFLFGGAVAGSTDDYLQQLVPGLAVQNTIMASFAAGVYLNTDINKGIFDRFRSLPIPRSAPLVGAVLADVVRYFVALTVLLLTAFPLGFTMNTSVPAFLTALVVIVVVGLCFCWMSVFVGMLVRTTASAQGLMTMFVIPLTFGSNVFVPTDTMPGWLATWSEFNPVSLIADVMRGLLLRNELPASITGVVLWLAGIVAVFFPLAMWAYRRRVG